MDVPRGGRFFNVVVLGFPGSAISRWRAGDAPVRGGTYFLCRRKVSKQRKRAHTANPCHDWRVIGVPMLSPFKYAGAVEVYRFEQELAV